MAWTSDKNNNILQVLIDIVHWDSFVDLHFVFNLSTRFIWR